MANYTIEIDTSDLQDTLNFVQQRLTPAQMAKVMRRVYNRAGGTIRKDVGQDVPRHYYVTSSESRKATGRPQIAGMGCTIPIRGPKLPVGNKFKATGSARGWESLRKKYKVKAKIVKAHESTIEGNPFRNMPSALGKQAYERKGGHGSRLPIYKVNGPAIPEMAETRAAPDIQKDVKETLEKRLIHEMEYILTR